MMQKTPEEVNVLRCLLADALTKHSVELKIEDPQMITLACIQLAAAGVMLNIKEEKGSGPSLIEWAMHNFFETCSSMGKELGVDLEISEIECGNQSRDGLRPVDIN